MPRKKSLSLPLLPSTSWWTLREMFKRGFPERITEDYLSTILGVKILSVKTNVLPYLKMVKLIDSQGRPLNLAKRWIDDEQYPAVCEEIRKDIYPSGLIFAFSAPLTEREGVEKWFADHTGVKGTALRRMVGFYLLLCEADPKKVTGRKKRASAAEVRAEGPGGNENVSGKSRAGKYGTSYGKDMNIESSRKTAAGAEVELSTKMEVPGINVNVQFHISADTSLEQIDQIFASMAKHMKLSGARPN